MLVLRRDGFVRGLVFQKISRDHFGGLDGVFGWLCWRNALMLMRRTFGLLFVLYLVLRDVVFCGLSGRLVRTRLLRPLIVDVEFACYDSPIAGSVIVRTSLETVLVIVLMEMLLGR